MASRKRRSRKKEEFWRGGSPWGCFRSVVARGRRGGLAGSRALSGLRPETFVDVAPGSSAVRIGQQLEAAGVVRSRYAFDVLRWFRHGTLQAGEYRFDHPAPVTEVYARIARGDVFTRTVTVPEGANIFDIARAAGTGRAGHAQEFS